MTFHKLIQRSSVFLLALLIPSLYATGPLHAQKKATDWLKLGLQTTDLDQKIANFQKAIELDPSLVEAHYNLGLALEKKGQTEEAVQSFGRALLSNPEAIDKELKLKIVHELGLLYARLGRYQEARESLVGALNLATQPKLRASILYELGRAESQLGNYYDATTHLIEGMKLVPEEEKKFREVLEEVQKRREIYEAYQEGLTHLQNGRYPEAVAALEKVINLDSNFRDVQTKLQQARQGLTQRQSEQEWETYYAEGLTHLEKKNWEQAINVFQKLANLNPNYKDVQAKLEQARQAQQRGAENGFVERYYNQGQAELERQNWSRAITAFKRVLARNPNYKDARQKLQQAQQAQYREGEDKAKALYYSQGLEAINKNDWQNAVSILERLVSLDSGYRDARQRLVQARAALKRQLQNSRLAQTNEGERIRTTPVGPSKEVTAFETAESVEPSNEDAQLELAKQKALAQLMTREQPRAAKPIKSEVKPRLTFAVILALTFIPATGMILLLPVVRARIYLWLGKHNKACQIYERLLEKKPGKVKLYQTLAQLYLLEHRQDERAIKIFEMVLRLNSNSHLKEEITSILAYHYLNQGQLDATRLNILESALETEIKRIQEIAK